MMNILTDVRNMPPTRKRRLVGDEIAYSLKRYATAEFDVARHLQVLISLISDR